MGTLRYSISVTLDGCCHHEAGLPPDEDSMRYWTASMERADAHLFGRVTYEMMESAWRKPNSGTWPGWMGRRDIPFAEVIDRARKCVVSSTLTDVDCRRVDARVGPRSVSHGLLAEASVSTSKIDDPASCELAQMSEQLGLLHHAVPLNWRMENAQVSGGVDVSAGHLWHNFWHRRRQSTDLYLCGPSCPSPSATSVDGDQKEPTHRS